MDTRDLMGADSDSSEDEASPGKLSSNQEHERTPFERQAFLFQNTMSAQAPDLHEFHPLPSQIPFLLEVFTENVNFVMQVVHMPTITKMVRDSRNRDSTGLTASNEALLFSIYYAAIISMEDEDVSSPLFLIPYIINR
jgi:hypothetical protein